MLSNVKQIILLCVIAILSGGIIFTSYTLTSDARFENAEKERLSIYLEFFPNADVTAITFEDISEGTLTQKATIYNDEGVLLGHTLKGFDTNALGDIEVLLAFSDTLEIIGIEILETENTADYIKNLENNHLPNLINTGLTNVSYDSNTGSTISYGSIQKMMADSRLILAGDPLLTVYQSVIDDVTDYSSQATFNLGAVTEEIFLYSGDTVIGTAYNGNLQLDSGTIEIASLIDSDGVFRGMVTLDGDTALPDATFTEIESLIGQQITDIDISDESSIRSYLSLSINRFLEDDAVRTLRSYFIDAARASDVTTIEDDVLHSVQTIFDESDNMLGMVFETQTRGYALPADYDDPYIRLKIVLDTEGALASIVVISHHETPGISSTVFDNIDALYGVTDTSNFDGDAFAGASYTADGVLEAVTAAQDYYKEMEAGS